MVSEYKIIFSKLADKDKKLLKQAGLEDKTMKLLDIIADNPYQDTKEVFIVRMWSHYDKVK